jgi:tetratricopeptide (TPR) repeat protein
MIVVCVVAVFVIGIGVGTLAEKKPGVTSSAWSDKTPAEAADALLDLAVVFAEAGSWENIHVGRVYYLGGQKEKAEAIFARYTSGTKVAPGDLIRIARVYAQAGEWDKAGPLFERVIEASPKDEDWLIEAGAYYNLNGDRERAEELFDLGFALSSKSLKNTLSAAGSYVGVTPRRR